MEQAVTSLIICDSANSSVAGTLWAPGASTRT